MTFSIGDMVIQDREKPYVYVGIVVGIEEWPDAGKDCVEVLWLNHYPNRAMVTQQQYSNPHYYFKRLS